MKYYMYICGNLRASIALQLNPLEFLFRFAHSHWFSSAATRHRSTVESRHGCTSILNGLPRQCSATNPRLRGILSEICIGKEDRRRTVRLTETPPFPKAKNQLAGKKTTNTPPPHTSSRFLTSISCVFSAAFLSSKARSFWASPDRHGSEIRAILCCEGGRCSRKKRGPGSNTHQYQAPEKHRA